MPFNQHTVVVCTAALRQDTNNMWRGLSNSTGVQYDASPVDSLPGTMSVPLAATLDTVDPWFTTPTHFLASTWELPEFSTLMTTLKAGGGNIITSKDWSPYNLNRQRSIAAASALYSRTVQLQVGEDPSTVANTNINAALTELGLQKIPSKPNPSPI